MNGHLRHQAGMTIPGFLVILFVGGITLTTAKKLYSPFADNRAIVSVIEGVVADPYELKKPIRDIKDGITRRLEAHQISLPTKDALKIEYTAGELHFDVSYESRVPMYLNLDAVVSFARSWAVKKPLQ